MPPHTFLTIYITIQSQITPEKVQGEMGLKDYVRPRHGEIVVLDSKSPSFH